jgi:DNA-binding NarL/FixJ family response regulator
MRVLVVDDHWLFRGGITSLLEADGFEVVGEESDGKSAVESALRLRPDLVLMDISMPIMGGLDAMQLIKTQMPEIRVVILTASEEDEDVINAIRLGADGYLLKSNSPEDFISNLHHLEEGEMAISRRLTSRTIKGLVGSVQPEQPREEPLTPRETELLTLIAGGASNKGIAVRLSLSENTVKYYIKRLMLRYDAQNRAEVVSQAIRAGHFKLPGS